MNRVLIFLLSLNLLIVFSCKDEINDTNFIPVITKSLYDTSSINYIDFSQYPKDLSKLPIGIFDSGTGGLTVLEQFLKLDNFDNITGAIGSDGIVDFAGEDFVYLADNANMPYGDYSKVNNINFLRELIVQDALFLLDDKFYKNYTDNIKYGKKSPVKVIVIACNTATAYGKKDIEQLLERSATKVKVVGVIDAAVNALFDKLQNNENVSVGVLATPGTISSGEYQNQINTLSGKRGFTSKVDIFTQSGGGFADAVEGVSDAVLKDATKIRDNYAGPVIGDNDTNINLRLLNVYNFDFSNNNILYEKNAKGHFTKIQLNSAANYARFYLVSLFEQHRKSESNSKMKSVILGCTHYPFVIDTLSKVVEELRHIGYNIAEDFFFIDPAKYTAIECYQLLRNSNNLAFNTDAFDVKGFISVPAYEVDIKNLNSDGSFKRTYKYGRKDGMEVVTTKFIPFSNRYIDEDTEQRLIHFVPISASYLQKNY